MSKMRQPILGNDLAIIELPDLEDADLDSVRIEGCALGKQTSKRVRFNSVRLVGGDLSETKVKGLSWLDVECARAQLPLIDWPEAKLTRVAFHDVRATGARLPDAELQDVRFTGCQLDYSFFGGARFSRVVFEKCRLREADFGGADLGGTQFLDCDLTGVTLVGAKLVGTDIRTCTGADIRIEARDVRGLVVSAAQAASLARLFGLVVRDDG
jgi:uncharacterized protein YjbI with pentapeptide repeats